MKHPQTSLPTILDNPETDTGWFCMELVGFIMKNKADYQEEFAKAKTGNCSYTTQCLIYKRTMEQRAVNGVQLELFEL